MKKSILRKLKDNQVFRISNRSSVAYRLLRLDKKTKTATYQSVNTSLTFERDWNKECLIG